MSKYSGYECIACGKKFTDDDDVVVCPECGTPYHRDCYLNNGKCINEELHQSGESWIGKSVSDSVASDGAEGDSSEKTSIRCPRCGSENAPDKLFCEKCGMPLITPENSVPFNDKSENSQSEGFGENGFESQAVFNQDSVVDGVRLGDYARYVGGNPLPFISKFIRFGKFGGKISLNVFAFLFPEVYFFYRKMNKWGIIFMIISAIVSIPTMVGILALGTMGVKYDFGFDVNSKMFTYILYLSKDLYFLLRFLAGLFANYIYYKHAKSDIENIYSINNTDNPEVVKDEITRKGGVSWVGVIVGYTVLSVIVSLGTFFLMFIK